MITLVSRTWKIVKKNFANLSIFLLVYHIGTLILIYNFSSTSINFALDKAGYSYLTTENIVRFICEPLSIILIILNLLVMYTVAGVEVVCLIENYRAVTHNIKLKSYEILVVGVYKILKMIREGFLYSNLGGLLSLPFLCLPFIVQVISGVKIFNYLVQHIYEHIGNEWILYIGVALILVIGLFTAFILPLGILNRENFKEAMFTTFASLKGKKALCWLYLILWNLAMGGIAVAFYFVFAAIAVGHITIMNDSQLMYSALLKACDYGKIVTAILSNILCIAGNIAFIYSIYMTHGMSSYSLNVDELSDYTSLINIGFKKRILFACVFVIAIEVWNSCTIIDKGTEIAQDLLVVTQITAHRGGAYYAPENTLAAIEKAIEMNSDYVEIDVQLTKDGEIVLLHDSNLKRTTGVNKNIWDVEYAEVARLDAGYKFSSEYKGERIPTLQEVLDYTQGKIDLNIEIKDNGHNNEIVEKVTTLVKENHAVHRCVITSMNYSMITDVKELNPDIRTGYILKMAYGNFTNRINADFISIKHTYVTKKIVDDAHNAGKEVVVWTVNSTNAIERMKRMKVDNIITDRPALVREMLADDNTLKGFVNLYKYVIQ